MRSGRFTAALLAFVVALVACRSPAAAPESPASALAKTHPRALFLYRVERAGHVSHLLGTIHVGFGFEEVLTPDAERAFEAARRVITEADIGEDPSARLIQAALLPAGESLEAMLDPSSWSELTARVGTQLPPPVLTRLRPWLPAMLLGLSELKQAFDEIKPEQGERMMDLELVARAKKAGKQVSHLETIDQQIAVFEKISLEEQLAELRQALTQNGLEQARALVQAYESGDEERLTKALFDAEQMESAPGFYETVLFARNQHWLPIVEQAAQEGGAFVAVGAAHLLGDRGLLKALAQRGYHVSRVE